MTGTTTLTAEHHAVLAQFRRDCATPAMYACVMLNPLPPWPRRLLLLVTRAWSARNDEIGGMVETLAAQGLLCRTEARRNRLMSLYKLTDTGRDVLAAHDRTRPGDGDG